MTQHESGDEGLSAGAFGPWLHQMLGALDGTVDADVPCATCVACCSSSQFVHVGPDEVDALAHIPDELLFPAPRMPRGHMLMGYDQHGRCPMLTDAGCSIYDHRPRTCRTYDCRVFPAAGVDVGDDTPLVAEQARRWRFEHPSTDDAQLHAAVLAAAAFVDEHRRAIADDVRPTSQAQLAVTAIEAHAVFLDHGSTRRAVTIDSVEVEVRSHRH